jgi:Dyp-type peroxidase family
MSRAFMGNVQGGILASRGRGRQVAVLLFRFKKSTRAHAVKNVGTVRAAEPLVTTALVQYERYGDGVAEIFRSFALSASGLAACGVEKLAPDGGFAPISPAVFFSMRKPEIARLLRDPVDDRGQPTTWQGPYRARIDGAWVLAHRDPAEVTRALADMKTWCAGNGLVVVGAERGAVPKDDDGVSREAFGFQDGVSMPKFFGPMPAQVATTLDEVFLKEPNVAGGSFLVLRKLEQNVTAFRKYTAEFGSRAAEEIVGRTKDGAPLDTASGTGKNGFDFSRDPEGKGCPFHAHVRRMNPRSTLVGARLRIVRRGVVYGLPGEPAAARAEPGTGLLFMAYMSHPGVFDEMQGNWSWARRHMGAPAGTPDDMLLLGPPVGTCPGVERWVIPRGGEYFFVPSVAWMRSVQPD